MFTEISDRLKENNCLGIIRLQDYYRSGHFFQCILLFRVDVSCTIARIIKVRFEFSLAHMISTCLGSGVERHTVLVIFE